MAILDELVPTLAVFLNQRGIDLIEVRRDQAFGNALVIARCAGIFLRILKDRDRVSIDLRHSGSDEWHSLENVLEFLMGATSLDPEFDFASQFSRVVDFLNSDLNEQGYVKFERQKAEAVRKRLFPE